MVSFLIASSALPVLASDPGDGSVRGGDEQAHLDPVIASGPASSLVLDDFEVVGRANLGGRTPNGDVFVYDHGGGRWGRSRTSGRGARSARGREPIVDVNDPNAPRWVGYVGAQKGSSNEDVAVTRIGGRDVLGIGVQAGGSGGRAGLALFDVTDPVHPARLAFIETASGAATSSIS